MRRVLAIDYGDVRVGLAMSDATNTIATGLETLEIKGNKNKLLDKIEELKKEYNITEVVFGYPKNMNGTMSEKTKVVDDIIVKLEKMDIGVDIVKRDERLTTVMAYNTMRDLGIKQKQKNKYADKLAAINILQDYLESSKTNT